MSDTKTPRTEAHVNERISQSCLGAGYEFCRQLETELASAVKENSEMRARLSKAVENLGNGGFAKSECSLEFLTKDVSNEVLLVVRDLRGELSVARQHVESLQRDFAKLREERDEWRRVATHLADALCGLEPAITSAGKAVAEFVALKNRK